MSQSANIFSITEILLSSDGNSMSPSKLSASTVSCNSNSTPVQGAEVNFGKPQVTFISHVQ